MPAAEALRGCPRAAESPCGDGWLNEALRGRVLLQRSRAGDRGPL